MSRQFTARSLLLYFIGVPVSYVSIWIGVDIVSFTHDAVLQRFDSFCLDRINAFVLAHLYPHALISFVVWLVIVLALLLVQARRVGFEETIKAIVGDIRSEAAAGWRLAGRAADFLRWTWGELKRRRHLFGGQR
jgi:hypothetical protein